MTFTSIGSSPDGYFSFNDNAISYPLPDVSVDDIPSLILGDTTLYAISNFFTELLNSNLLPRFAEDMFNIGVKNAVNPNYYDGVAVKQTVFYPLYPNILTTNSFKFPLLSVSQTGMEAIQFTTVKTSIKRDFAATWVLPPMDAAQLAVLQPHLSIAAKAWIGYGATGYDPKFSTVSAWKTAGVAFGEMGKVSFKPFQGMAPNASSWKEVIFPAMTMTLSFWENNQLGLPQPNTQDFTQASIQLNVADGYNLTNPIYNLIDGYVNPILTLTSFSPSSGSIQGDTLVYLTGTGFISNRTYTVSFNGSVSTNTFVRSPVMLQVITNPAINAQVGVGDIIVTDNFSNTFTINGWSYASP